MDNGQDRTMLQRINTLVDSFFAIVMTILVLDIKIPHTMEEYREVTIQNFLTGYYEDILLYMVVFIALGYLWYIHNELTKHINRTNRTHLLINIVTLMFIALIPFSSSVVNRFTDDWLAESFLAANMMMIGICNYLNWAYAAGDRRLIDKDISASLVTAKKKRLLISPFVSAMAILTSFIYPVAASYVLLLAPILVFFKNPQR